MFELVVVLNPLLHIAAFDAGIEGIGRIGRDFLTKQIQRQGIMQIELFLDGRQIKGRKVGRATLPGAQDRLASSCRLH